VTSEEGEIVTRLKEASEELASELGTRPVFLVGLGRGRVGKSTGLRLLIDRARHAGRKVLAADGDRSNATLAAYYPDVTRPRSAEDDDLRVWLTELLDRAATERVSVALDLGGGDPILAKYGRDLGLVEFCESVGIRPVALYFLGPHLDDLKHVKAIEESGAFCPKDTVLVLNGGLVSDAQSEALAFEPIVSRPEFGAILERGVYATMPRLACLSDLPAGVGFYDVKRETVGPVRHHMLGQWRRKMEEGFTSALAFLP